MTHSRFLLTVPLLCFISCSGPLYYPAIQGSYVPGVITAPPQGENSSSTAKYLVLDGGNALSSNEGERNILVRGHFLSVRSGKYYAANAGLFAYGGSYRVNAVEEYRGEHSFFGGGLEFNGELHYPFWKVDAGLGMYAGGAFECGDYPSFRENAYQRGLIANHPTDATPLFAVYPLVRYRATKRTSVAFQYAFGFPGLISPSVTIQHDNYATWFYLIADDTGSLAESFFSIGIGRQIQ